jgi:DNA-binding GntR family transcriptional regulator
MLTAIARTPSLSMRAKELIQTAIWSGELPPGAHLVETQLAARFGISRGPLREALQALAAEGLVEIQPGRGAFVVNPTSDEMEDMIVLRAVLGGMAARYVAACRDDRLFAQLAQALRDMRRAMEEGNERRFFDGHWVFYETMYGATNAVLTKAWLSLHGLCDIYVRRMGRPHLPLARILLCYESFLSLFRAGDVDEAEAVVRSQSLIAGFQILGRPIPRKLWGYVTRQIREDGSVAPFYSEVPGDAPPTGDAWAESEKRSSGPEADAVATGSSGIVTEKNWSGA